MRSFLWVFSESCRDQSVSTFNVSKISTCIARLIIIAWRTMEECINAMGFCCHRMPGSVRLARLACGLKHTLFLSAAGELPGPQLSLHLVPHPRGAWFVFMCFNCPGQHDSAHFGHDPAIALNAGADFRSVNLRVLHREAWLWPKRVMLCTLKMHLQLLEPRFLNRRVGGVVLKFGRGCC